MSNMLQAKSFSTNACLCSNCNTMYMEYHGSDGYTALYKFDGGRMQPIKFGRQKKYPCSKCGYSIETTERFITRDYQCPSCWAPFIDIHFNGESNVYESGDRTIIRAKKEGTGYKCRYCKAVSQLPNE